LQPLAIKDIAQFLQGEIVGDEGLHILGVSKIDQGIQGTLSFLANPKYEEHLESTEASAILVSKERELPKNGKSFIQVDDPYLAFCKVMNQYFNPIQQYFGVSESAHIDPSADIAEGVYIGANAVIEADVRIEAGVKIFPNTFIGSGSVIGEDTVIHPNTSVYRDSIIGKRTIIHSGTVIGSDGFGHAPQKDGTYVKIPQIGNVVIGDDVEIGSNCSIDRATIGSTVIEDGCRLDNLIQVAHNVVIGANTVIAGQAGVSGSTTLGKNCVIGGQVGFAGHINIADGTQIGAQSGLAKSVEEKGQQLFGSPAVPLKEALRTHLIIRKLPEMREQIKELQNTIRRKDEE